MGSIECQGPEIQVKSYSLYHVLYEHDVFVVSDFQRLLPINCLAVNRLATDKNIPSNKIENSEELCQSTSGKPIPT